MRVTNHGDQCVIWVGNLAVLKYLKICVIDELKHKRWRSGLQKRR